MTKAEIKFEIKFIYLIVLVLVNNNNPGLAELRKMTCNQSRVLGKKNN